VQVNDLIVVRPGGKIPVDGEVVEGASALTQADVGMAMGSGTDVAIDSADLVLTKSDPLDVVRTIEITSEPSTA
jgi:Cu2+-exporting ATPase